jgi:hypothetical protein
MRTAVSTGGATVTYIEDQRTRPGSKRNGYRETIKGNSATVGDYAPTTGYFAELSPTEEDIDDHFDLCKANSGNIVPTNMLGVRCTLCGVEFHKASECYMKTKFPAQNKSPLALWKYASQKDPNQRKNLLKYLEHYGIWSKPEMRTSYEEFERLVEIAAAEEALKAAQRGKSWQEAHPAEYAAQLAAQRRRGMSYQPKDNPYGPSEGLKVGN